MTDSFTDYSHVRMMSCDYDSCLMILTALLNVWWFKRMVTRLSNTCCSLIGHKEYARGKIIKSILLGKGYSVEYRVQWLLSKGYLVG